jgi:integrase
MFQDAIKEKHWASQTVDNYQQTLLTIFKRALDDKIITEIPKMDHVKNVAGSQRRNWTFEEEQLFRKTLQTHYPTTARYRLAQFDLALHTGMRKGNMYGLHGNKRKPTTAHDCHGSPLDWNDVNRETCEIKLRWAKRGKGYTVPLNKVAMAAIKILSERSSTGPVIRDERDGSPLQSPKNWFEKVRRKAGLKDLCWHSLRHTFSTRLDGAGVPMKDELGAGIVQLMNHKPSDSEITLGYIHRSESDRLHQYVARLETYKPAMVIPFKNSTDTKTDTENLGGLKAAVGGGGND